MWPSQFNDPKHLKKVYLTFLNLGHNLYIEALKKIERKVWNLAPFSESSASTEEAKFCQQIVHSNYSSWSWKLLTQMHWASL